LNKRLMVVAGLLLVLVAVVLFMMQHYGFYHFYGDVSNKWYFYGLVSVIGVVGLVMAAWAYRKGQ